MLNILFNSFSFVSCLHFFRSFSYGIVFIAFPAYQVWLRILLTYYFYIIYVYVSTNYIYIVFLIYYFVQLRTHVTVNLFSFLPNLRKVFNIPCTMENLYAKWFKFSIFPFKVTLGHITFLKLHIFYPNSFHVFLHIPQRSLIYIILVS